MVHWRWKIVLAALLLFLAILNIFWGNYGYTILVILLIAIPVLLIFKNEWVILALYQIRKQNLDKSLYFLEKIKNPTQVIPLKKDVAYYYYLMGLAQTNTKNFQKAETNMKKALDLGLKDEMDQAVANLQLAAIFANRRQLQIAQQYLKKAKKQDKKGLLTEQIAMFEQQLKTPYQQVMRHR